jgi:hypothetical protein
MLPGFVVATRAVNLAQLRRQNAHEQRIDASPESDHKRVWPSD